ncbi:hypothetical protein DMN91_010995 [Ooceraea biroi]|uniref:Uncharacterized protein n=1 Tax=Ooceraea biroi TaxID=2015173 RepID=A0A3L8D9C3_OOCBI|nr:uncharacterized protein LOC105280604 [Ooceraea biroi]RLU16926.1 hypothetical protein DMN91_010995 [Ooceraea biroi]
MYIAEDQLRGDTQTVDTQSLSDSVIAINESIITRFPFSIYNKYNQNWRADPEMSRHYWAASFFLPIGSIFVLGMVVLLMVLFKRCPHTVAAIVAAILTIIIVLATVVSLNHEPVYT